MCEDVSYGKISRPWAMLGFRPARPRGSGVRDPRSCPRSCASSCTPPFPLSKSIIGRIYVKEMKVMGAILMKMADFLKGNAFCVADFPISYLKLVHWSIFKEEMSENENSARPRCDFIYTKNSARPGSGFYLHKE